MKEQLAVMGSDGVKRRGTWFTLGDWDLNCPDGAPHQWLEDYVPTEPTHDPVERPSHYTKGPVECIDGIRSALGPEGFRAYCKGNAIKYLWRAGLKGPEAEDLGKAEVYIRWAKQSAEGDR